MSAYYANNDNTGDDHDSTTQRVVDISEAWLAAVENAELFSDDVWALRNEVHQRAAIKVRGMLNFVERRPTFQSVRRKADEIFEAVQYATGIHKLILPALLIVEALLSPLEQLQEWERLDKWFIQIYPIIVDRAPKELPRWRRLVFQHYQSTGELQWRDNAADDAAEDGKFATPDRIEMVMLSRTTSIDECRRIAGEMLTIAKLNRDHKLMMSVHAFMALRHLERFEAEPAFEHAQQAFCLATLLNDGQNLARMATCMATVFQQQTGKPAKALDYAQLAMDHAVATLDRRLVNHVRALQGFCYYALGHYQEAVTALKIVLPKLNPRGIFYARALYIWCAAFSYLEPTKEQLSEIEDQLIATLDIFKRQNSYADILTTQMALVHTALDQEDMQKAQMYYDEDVTPLITAPSGEISEVHAYYIGVLKQRLSDSGLRI